MKPLMMGLANHADTIVARRLGESCPFVVVAEFPRSGGNWIRDVLSDYLQIPVSRRNLLPTTTHALVQSHTAIPLRRGRCIYNFRDGRDVFISHFWHCVNVWRSGNQLVRHRLRRLHPSLLHVSPSPSPSPSPSQRDLLAFYDEWRVRPAGSRQSWGTHVTRWLTAANPEIVPLRYEDLRARPQDVLPGLAAKIAGFVPEDYILDFAVRRNLFEAKAGRKPGEILNSDRRRSGLVGGWRDELSGDLKARFVADFGDALALAGYEV